MKIKNFIFCLGVLVLASCDKAVRVPSYIHIAAFQFTASNAQGGSSFDIANGQVLIDDIFVGNYELPVTIPIDNDGYKRIEIFPAIKENGISNGRKVYKLYESFVSNVNMVRGKVDSVKPTSTYKSSAHFEWLENFDNNSTSLKKGNNNTLSDSLSIFPFTHPNAYKGSNMGYSAGIFFPLNSTGQIWEALTISEFEVPKLGTDVYVELDLLSDVDVKIGILYFDGVVFKQVEVVQFFATEGKWKKLYANLLTEVAPLAASTKVSIFIGGVNGTDGSGTPKVFIDNLKLAYLK